MGEGARTPSPALFTDDGDLTDVPPFIRANVSRFGVDHASRAAGAPAGRGISRDGRSALRAAPDESHKRCGRP